MKNKIANIFCITICSLISGCCYNFSDLTVGTTYIVGQSIVTPHLNILVEQFQWSNANWTSDGFAKIDNRSYAGGSGFDLNANNVNLKFLFNYPLSEISLKFGELGGNCNIKVNDDFKNIQDLIDLQNISLGGVPLTIDAIQSGNNWSGEIILKGIINSFTIGGQELWINDICTKD